MDYGWTFARKIRCSNDDKSDCLRLISEILTLAKKARGLGLLSLIEYIENCPHPFLGKGLQLIVDGEKPHAVREIMEIAIMSAGYRGKALLERCIILEGLMGIQSGLNPKSLKELLLAFLDEEAGLRYENEFGQNAQGDLESFLKSLEHHPAPARQPSGLNQLFSRLSDDAIQQSLKEISTMDLAMAFRGLSANTQMRIFNNLPKRGAAFLREALEQMEQAPPEGAGEAQERIEAVLKDLAERKSLPDVAN
jgi:hypothetical protein